DGFRSSADGILPPHEHDELAAARIESGQVRVIRVECARETRIHCCDLGCDLAAAPVERTPVPLVVPEHPVTEEVQALRLVRSGCIAPELGPPGKLARIDLDALAAERQSWIKLLASGRIARTGVDLANRGDLFGCQAVVPVGVTTLDCGGIEPA